MNKLGPIVVIEDDLDDWQFMQSVFHDLSLPNEIVFYQDGGKALEYLMDDNVHPFLIFSDMNLPMINGVEVRERINSQEKHSLKCIPFVFFSTHIDRQILTNCYMASVQGVFEKPHSYQELKDTVRMIVQYWSKCIPPDVTKFKWNSGSGQVEISA